MSDNIDSQEPITENSFFADGLAKAIEVAKQTNSLFVVVVVNDNDISNRLLEIFNNENLLKYLNTSKRFITVKVLQDSQDFNNFIQFCPCSEFPSLYFLSNTGQIINKQLEFQEDQLNSEFIEKLFQNSLNTFTQLTLLSLMMLQKSQQNTPSQTPTPQPLQPKPTVNKNTPYPIPNKPTNSDKTNIVNKPPPKKNTTTTTTTTTSVPKPSTPSLNNSNSNNNNNNNSASSYILPPISNILIKLTNGETIRNQFLNDDKLKIVKDYIDMNRTDSNSSYSLMTIHPKRIFQEKDFNMTLLELQLVPSATLVLIGNNSGANSPLHTPTSPVSSSSTPNNSSYSSYLSSYYTSIKNSLSNIIGGQFLTPQQHDLRENQKQDQPTSNVTTSRSNIHSLSSSTSNSNSKNNSNSNSNVKKRNIHQIHDTDDNNNTKEDGSDSYYNGNSTQFK